VQTNLNGIFLLIFHAAFKAAKGDLMDMGEINFELHKSLLQQVLSSSFSLEDDAVHLNSHEPKVALPDKMFLVVERFDF
jgi:predicted Zn-dependent protease